MLLSVPRTPTAASTSSTTSNCNTSSTAAPNPASAAHDTTDTTAASLRSAAPHSTASCPASDTKLASHLSLQATGLASSAPQQPQEQPCEHFPPQPPPLPLTTPIRAMKRLTKSEEVVLMRVVNAIMPFTAVHGEKHARWIQVAASVSQALGCAPGVISDRLCRDVAHRVLKSFQEKQREGLEANGGVDNPSNHDSLDERDRLCIEVRRKISYFRGPSIHGPMGSGGGSTGGSSHALSASSSTSPTGAIYNATAVATTAPPSAYPDASNGGCAPLGYRNTTGNAVPGRDSNSLDMNGMQGPPAGRSVTPHAHLLPSMASACSTGGTVTPNDSIGLSPTMASFTAEGEKRGRHSLGHDDLAVATGPDSGASGTHPTHHKKRRYSVASLSSQSMQIHDIDSDMDAPPASTASSNAISIRSHNDAYSVPTTVHDHHAPEYYAHMPAPMQSQQHQPRHIYLPQPSQSRQAGRDQHLHSQMRRSLSQAMITPTSAFSDDLPRMMLASNGAMASTGTSTSNSTGVGSSSTSSSSSNTPGTATSIAPLLGSLEAAAPGSGLSWVLRKHDSSAPSMQPSSGAGVVAHGNGSGGSNGNSIPAASDVSANFSSSATVAAAASMLHDMATASRTPPPPPPLSQSQRLPSQLQSQSQSQSQPQSQSQSQTKTASASSMPAPQAYYIHYPVAAQHNAPHQQERHHHASGVPAASGTPTPRPIVETALANLIEMMAAAIRNQSEQIRLMHDHMRREAADRHIVLAALRTVLDRLGPYHAPTSAVRQAGPKTTTQPQVGSKQVPEFDVPAESIAAAPEDIGVVTNSRQDVPMLALDETLSQTHPASMDPIAAAHSAPPPTECTNAAPRAASSDTNECQ